VVVATTYYGARHTTSNKPITKCSDLKGLKMRVPDAPAYVAMPRACGANTSPIAFAEVYLALQNGTVEAQENPLPSIEAKKFYEVQKNIALTGHILDAVNTVVSGKTWKMFNDAEKKLFTELAQEGAQKGSADIVAREKELVDIFKQKGLSINEVDRNDFRNTVLQKVKFEDFGYLKSDYDRIQAIK
jgi:TRAP-type C4-dicarboxylate transport system substrate-binding protein